MNHLEPEDKSLDCLLSHLTSVQPDHGFKERLLRGAERQVANKRPQRARTRFWRFGLSCASAAAVAVVVSLQLTHSRPASEHKVQPAIEPVVITGRVAPQPLARRTTSAAPLADLGLSEPKKVSRSQADPSDPDPLQLASFPAPPAPLTEQERLLLCMARTSTPDQLAILVPEKRAAAQAAEAEAYVSFFPPPPPLPPEPQILQQP